MTKIYFVPENNYDLFIKTFSKNKEYNEIVKNNDEENKIFMIEKFDDDLGIKSNSDDNNTTHYLTDDFNISIDNNKKSCVIIFNNHNEIKHVRNKKITELLYKLDISDLSIFNYTTFGEEIDEVQKINTLNLNGNIHSMFSNTVCDMPNNLPRNIINLSITSPPDDNVYITSLPNKLKVINSNLFLNYLPNSLIELSQSNDDNSKIKYANFNNKIKKISLTNNIVNDGIIIDKLPTNITYLAITAELWYSRQENNIYGNFKLSKNIIKYYTKMNDPY